MKQIIRMFLVAAVFCTACSGCPDERGSPKPAVVPGAPAIAAVNTMFRRWHEKELVKMAQLLTNCGELPEFVLAMTGSPVTFRKLSVGPARRFEDAWLVQVKMEVTDIASVMTSVMRGEYMRTKADLGSVDIILPPEEPAERFRTVSQEMVVHCSDNNVCKINVCRDGNSCSRKQNILNYARDAGRIMNEDRDEAVLAVLAAKGSNQSTLRQAVWLKRAMGNLGIGDDKVSEIMSQAFDLYAKTATGRLEMIQKMHERASAQAQPAAVEF